MRFWLPAVGSGGWVVLTSDDTIRYRHAEMSPANSAAVVFFIPTGKRMRGFAIADALVKALPGMRAMLAENTPPFVAKVSGDGNISLPP